MHSKQTTSKRVCRKHLEVFHFGCFLDYTVIEDKKMLSNLVVTPQRFVIIVDELGQENISMKFLTQLLREQGEDGHIKILPICNQLGNKPTLQKFLSDCNCKSSDGKPWNVILPTLSDFLAYQQPSEILNFINKLKHSDSVKRTFFWISIKHVIHDQSQFLIAACEYMADLVLYLQTANELSVLTKKPGGGVTNNRYTYTKSKTEFMVKLMTVDGRLKLSNDDAEHSKAEQLGTFKIELDEEEMMARKAMKMPYEKALEATESNIIYTPDAGDDFDEEDPDEDLNI